MSSIDQLITSLQLEPHPEGGFYRETWRSQLQLSVESLPEGYQGARSAGTCIQFLLRTGERSRLHRVLSDELWLHQQGDPIRLTMTPSRESAEVHRPLLGAEPGAVLQAMVPGGWWQAAQALPGDRGYALVACVVVPGFDFKDFELG